jgi:hypothetical protein
MLEGIMKSIVKRVRNYLITFIAKHTGFGYNGSRVTPDITGFGIYHTKYNGPSLADPAYLLKEVVTFRIGTKGYSFGRGDI